MKNNTQSYQICPVCYQHCIDVPNGVCLVCYNKEKKDYVHEYEWHDEEYQRWHYEREPVSPEIREENIRRRMKDEWEEWDKISQNGLSAIQVFIDILDTIDDTDNNMWHRRRIRFMKDMVERLDNGYFPNATKQQIADFAQSAVDFWDGRITHKEAHAMHEKMCGVLHKKREDIGKWEAKDFLLWMMETKEHFDWMWEQWFDCIHQCIPDSYNDSTWIQLIHKHFPEEIKEWVTKD